VGGLLPYGETVEHLIRQQFDRYEAWLAAMDRAGVERHLFSEAGGDVLRPAWNPVRLNRQGTVELRGMDSNYPEVTLTAAELVITVANRVRRESLSVTPDDGVRAFELDGDTLRVPGFEYLIYTLLHGAVAGEAGDSDISDYLDSILEFAGEDGRLAALRRHRCSTGAYRITESLILREYGSGDGRISEEEGLRLVLEACDELETQVLGLSRKDETAADISRA